MPGSFYSEDGLFLRFGYVAFEGDTLPEYDLWAVASLVFLRRWYPWYDHDAIVIPIHSASDRNPLSNDAFSPLPGCIPTELVHLLLAATSFGMVYQCSGALLEWIEVERLKTRSRAIETYMSWCVLCVIKLPSMRPGSPLRCSYCCWLAIRYVLPRTCGKEARGHWQVCAIILVLTWNICAHR